MAITAGASSTVIGSTTIGSAGAARSGGSSAAPAAGVDRPLGGRTVRGHRHDSIDEVDHRADVVRDHSHDGAELRPGGTVRDRDDAVVVVDPLDDEVRVSRD